MRVPAPYRFNESIAETNPLFIYCTRLSSLLYAYAHLRSYKP